MKKIAIMMGIAVMAVSCSHKNQTTAPESAGTAQVPVTGGEPAAFMPKATAFKMSGAYADKVAVTVNPNGVLTYFPSPSDITPASRPVYLGNGWWLNCQGIGPNSVFTSWSFDEYASLSATPTPSEIKAHIIPGAEVTEFFTSTVPLTEATSQLSKIKSQLP